MMNMTVGDRIKQRRLDLGMTQAELAKKCNTTYQAISKYENNLINDIPRKKLAIIADALDCSPAFLLGFPDEPQVEEARDELKEAQHILLSASSKLKVEDILLLAKMAESMRKD